ncbi:MAG: Winged helix-turn helix [Glomeribacter sp. 1016415]|nr:Winged helix-turn helix [Glomeribacter sp. 1016415]
MEMIYEIRRRYKVQKQSISAIAREMGLSRPTVRKHVETVEEPKYDRIQPIRPQLGACEGQLEQWLEQEAKFPRGRRRTARRLFEGLQEMGYPGAYDSVQRFVKDWKLKAQGPRVTQVFVPLVFEPADACQFDWSHEHVELGGVGQMTLPQNFGAVYWQILDAV